MARLQLAWLIISLVLIIFSFGPRPTAAVLEGSTITLICRTGVDVSIVVGALWYLDDVPFASLNSIYNDDPRYANFVLENADTAIGQMDLIINDAAYDDEGVYRCGISLDTGQFIDQPCVLTVEVAAESLTMTVNGTVGEFSVLEDGVETEAVCTVLGARPQLEIDWYLGDTLMTGANVTNNTNVNDRNTSDTISSLWFTKVKCTRTIRCETTGQFETPSLSQTQALASLGVGSIIGIAAPGTLAVMMLLIGLALQE